MRILIKFFAFFLHILIFGPLIITPVYNFPPTKPFSGDKIWNPYDNLEIDQWKKANFQVQSRAWGGITDGRNNTFDKVWKKYDELNYDFIGISDYQKINTVAKDSSGYIPIYEHGYNFWKTHQVNIGAKEVLWLDFPFFQTTNQKQFLINLQRGKTDILALAHPAFSLEGYSHSDLEKLTNYDLLEALNMQIFSLSHWDAALSAGRISYILANDDVHDIDDAFWYGRVATMVNTNSLKKSTLINALKEGKSYGLTPYTPNFDTHDKKIKRVKSIPYLLGVDVKTDTLIVVGSKGVKKIHFFGQNGTLKKTLENSDTGIYIIKEEDSYIRAIIDYGRDEKLYLNPVFRYSGEKPKNVPPATINWIKTSFSSLIFLIIFIFITFLIFRKWK
jgi:hypothetical protein